MSAQEVVVHRDAASLCETAADRLITRVVDAQAAQAYAHVCLTGGRSGLGVLAAVNASPARDAVDWRRLDLWWSDERFLPAGDPERNDTGAFEALLDHVPLDPARIHPMPTPQGTDGDDPEAAAERYAADLARAARPEDRARVPAFDVVAARRRRGRPRGVAVPGPARHARARALPSSPSTARRSPRRPVSA